MRPKRKKKKLDLEERRNSGEDVNLSLAGNLVLHGFLDSFNQFSFITSEEGGGGGKKKKSRKAQGCHFGVINGHSLSISVASLECASDESCVNWLLSVFLVLNMTDWLGVESNQGKSERIHPSSGLI